jgi:hypothetical protein
MAKKRGKKQSREKRELKIFIKLFVEGETEKKYLLKIRHKRRISIKIAPEFTNNLTKNDIELIFNQIKNDIKDPSIKNIHVIIEMDHYLNSNNSDYINYIKNFIKNVKNLGLGVYLIYPCIEYWFLNHFDYVNKQFQNCDEVIEYMENNLCSILEKFIANLGNQNWIKNNYHHIFDGDRDDGKIDDLKSKLIELKDKFCKSGKFDYKKNDDEFLDMLLDLHLEKFAIYNAKKLGNFSFDDKNPALEIYKLFEQLINQ